MLPIACVDMKNLKIKYFWSTFPSRSSSVVQTLESKGRKQIIRNLYIQGLGLHWDSFLARRYSAPPPAMSVNLVSNVYLDENSARIKAKPVPWEVSILLSRSLSSPQVTEPLQRDISVQDWSPLRSLHSSKRSTDSRVRRLSLYSSPMARHTHSCICACSRNSRGMILSRASWCLWGTPSPVRGTGLSRYAQD